MFKNDAFSDWSILVCFLRFIGLNNDQYFDINDEIKQKYYEKKLEFLYFVFSKFEGDTIFYTECIY